MKKFIKTIAYTALAIEIVLAFALAVIGGFADGWLGIFMMLCGLVLLVHILYRYNKPYR